MAWTSCLEKITVAALTAAPIMALRAMLFIMSLAVSSFLPAPIIWFSSIAVPVDIMNEATMTTLSIWLVTPTAADALSDMRLTMKVFTVPIRDLRICSRNIGTAILSTSRVVYLISIYSSLQ